MILNGNRSWASIGVAATLALASPGWAAPDIIGGIKGMIPGMGFSVSGKPGTFLSQAAKRKLEPLSKESAASLNFAGDSRGEFQTARMRMPQTEARLENLLAQIDAKWPYAHPAKIKVHLIADGKYGPNALPDGSIAVPIGFLTGAKSDDEVMFVLSHEYAHLALTHFARADRMRSQHKLLRTVAEFYSAGVEMSGIRAQQSGQQIQFTSGDRKRIEAARDRATADKDQLEWILNNLVEPAWSRRQEDEADALGLDLAHAIGKAAFEGAGEAFDHITADDTARQTLVSGLQTRISESLTEASNAGNKGSSTDPKFDPSAFANTFSKTLQNGLRDHAMRSIEGYLSARHRPPEERKRGIVEYAALAYKPALPPMEVKANWLNETRAAKDFIAARTAVSAFQKAQAARGNQDYSEAEQQIKKALATSYGGLPLFTNEAGRIFWARKNFKSAELQFTKADSHLEQTLDGFSAHVDMSMETKAYSRALQVIALYRTRSKTDKDFLPRLILINFKLHKNEEAVALLERCMDYDEPHLRDKCAIAASGVDDAELDKLPLGVQHRVRTATSKAASKLSLGSGLGDLVKNLGKSEQN